MAAPTEQQVLECLTDNCRKAAEYSEQLAKSPKRGQIYLKFRECLSLVEGAARQTAYYRGGDARWLEIGIRMAEAHKRAGDWLRGVQQPGGGRRPLPEGQKHPLFMKMADNLRKCGKLADDLRTKKTNRRGPILPTMRQPTSQRPTTPIGWTKSAGGILLPAGA